MKDTVVVALIGGVATLVGAIPTIATLRSRSETKKDLGVIHVLVNSQLTDVKNQLTSALGEIEKLREYIDSKIKDIPNVSSIDLVPPPPVIPAPLQPPAAK